MPYDIIIKIMIIIIIIIIMLMVMVIIIRRRIHRCKSRFITYPHCAANCLQHVRSVVRAQSCANHVQHIKLLSRATCPVQLGIKAQLLRLTDMKLIHFIG